MFSYKIHMMFVYLKFGEQLYGSVGFEGFGTIFTAKVSFFSMSARFMKFESFFDFEYLSANITS